MKPYIVINDTVHFRQGNLPAQWMPAFSQMDVYVHITNDKRYPYSVRLSEADFLSIIELAKEL